MAVATATAIQMTPTAAGVEYRELQSPLVIVAVPKRKNRWQITVLLDGALVSGTVLDPADAPQRKKLLAECTLASEQAAAAMRLLLYAGQHLAEDSAAWQHWQLEERARKRTEAAEAAAAEEAAHARVAQDERTKAAWAQGCALLTDPRLLYNVGPMLKRLGLAGEEQLGRTLYLVFTSRITPSPINHALRGGSSAGKSYTVKQVMRLFPVEAFWTLTGMSAKALVYTQEAFAHRYVVLFEYHGGEASDYLIRTLQSEGVIKYETVEKEDGRIVSRTITKDGPTGFCTTTTKGVVHDENDTRMWLFDADESEEQTGRVNDATAHQFNSRPPDPVLDDWQAAQVWLSLAGAGEAEIPYSHWLSDRMPKKPLRIRRDFGRLLTLISTSAVLFQAQRTPAADGRVIATVADYANAYALAGAIFTDTLRAVPTRTRTILDRLEALSAAKQAAATDGRDVYVTYRDLRLDMGKDTTYLSRHMQAAFKAGLAVNLESSPGKEARLQPRSQGIEDSVPGLPDPEELAQAFPHLGGSWIHPMTGDERIFPSSPPDNGALVTRLHPLPEEISDVDPCSEIDSGPAPVAASNASPADALEVFMLARAARHGYPALEGEGWQVAAGKARWETFLTECPDYATDAVNLLTHEQMTRAGDAVAAPLHADTQHPVQRETATLVTSAPLHEGIEEKFVFDYVTDPAALADAMATLSQHQVIGFDVETTGLDPRRDRLRLLTLAGDGAPYVIDTWRCPGWQDLVRPLFADMSKTIIGHNARFDLRFLLAAGIEVDAVVHDTLVQTQLIDAGVSYDEQEDGTAGKRRSYALAAVVERSLGQTLSKEQQASDWSLPTLSTEQLAYAARDAAILLPLYAHQRAAIGANGLERVATIEAGCTPALAWLEYAGMPFAADAWRLLSDAAVLEEQRLRREIMAVFGKTGANQFAGYRLKLESTQQLRLALGTIGIDIPDTNEETLQAVRDRHDVVPLLLAWRDASKRASVYGIQFVSKHLHPSTGRVHGEYQQLGSAAGRMSCVRPNLQNVPRAKEYRACFRAPDGLALVKCDYSQIEVRIIAAIANDRAMLDAYRTGADLYKRTASAVLGVPEEVVSKEQRQLAKVLVLGLQYGMGAATLAQHAAGYGVSLSLDEATQYRDRFFASYTGLRRWHQSQPRETITTRTLAGRARMGVETFMQKVNSPIQGSGADGLKAALGRLWRHRHEAPTAHLVATVHDEIVAECPVADAPAVATWLQRHMVAAMSEIVAGKVPIAVEATIARDWAGTPLAADESLQGFGPNGDQQF